MAADKIQMRMLLLRNRRLLLQTCLYLGSVVFVWYLFKSHTSTTSHNIAHSFNINALASKVLSNYDPNVNGIMQKITLSGQVRRSVLRGWPQEVDRQFGREPAGLVPGD